MIDRRSMLGSLAVAALLPAASLDSGPIVTITAADGRPIAVTRWRATRRRGIILFSHGALSAPTKYVALIAPWVAAGFDVWAPLHVDSTDHPDTARFAGLASWPARIADLRALARHVGLSNYIAAGHSYGALVALTLGGASAVRPVGIDGPLRDVRARSVVAFSPPGPSMGLIDATGYATLAVPAFVQTGTLDVPPGGGSDAWRGHLAAYDAPPAGGERYALVLEGADHYFGGLICRPELPGPKQHAQFEVAVAQSLAFLRGYGLGEARVRRALVTSASTAPATAPGLYRR